MPSQAARGEALPQGDGGERAPGPDCTAHYARENVPVCHAWTRGPAFHGLRVRNCCLPQAHLIDALCIATLSTGEKVPVPQTNIYHIGFRPRQTRRQYHDLPRKGRGRVRYQVNDELEGFRKGDLVRVKGRYVKQVNSIYSEGRLAFRRVKGEPANVKPQDCQLLERGRTMLWERVT